MPTAAMPMLGAETSRWGRPLTARERHIIEDITRREFIVGGAAAGVLVLGGCSDDGGSSPAADTEADFPRTVEHIGGTTTVPAKPERVVCISGEYELEAMVALGAPIVGANIADRDMNTPWYADLDLSAFGQFAGQNLEAIAELQPDLLIVPDYGPEGDGRPELEQIAPLVFLPSDFRGQLTTGGFATGLDDAGRRAIEGLDALARDFDPAWRPESIAVCNDDGGVVGCYSGESAASAPFELLGLPRISPQVGDYAEVSFELLPDFAADIDLMIGVYVDEQFEGQPVVQNLPLVREGRYAAVDPTYQLAFNSPGVLSLPFLADEIARILMGTAG
ncbi:MAG: ABC transporter substrate-binding protein [Actinomycetota bacterium]